MTVSKVAGWEAQGLPLDVASLGVSVLALALSVAFFVWSGRQERKHVGELASRLDYLITEIEPVRGASRVVTGSPNDIREWIESMVSAGPVTLDSVIKPADPNAPGDVDSRFAAFESLRKQGKLKLDGPYRPATIVKWSAG